MGVDIDQLTAQLSTIISVTRQDASSVGTALKTICARMGDLKVDGVDEFGVTLGDVSGTLKEVGIEVLDTQGNLRDMGTVMEEVASKWGTWTEAQQQAIAVAMAGKRQYNNLLALFENWEMYESALSTSENSEGTLQRQQDIYMDSLEGHLNQLSVAGEKVYDAIFDSESMKGFISTLTEGVNLFAGFIDAIGGGGSALLAFGTIAFNVFRKNLAEGIATAVNNIGTFYSNTVGIAQEIAYTTDLKVTASAEEIPGLNTIIELKEEELSLIRFLKF
jgi:TP901 family phage tail tape measure protein